MTTSTADPTSPRSSSTHLTTESSSFILKELTEPNLSLRCCDDECFYPPPLLREIPTSKLSEPAATAVVDILDNNDDDNILIVNAQEDATPAPTFHQEWEAFYREFKTSTTYALAHSSAASLMPSLVADDDADDDRKIHECEIDQLPTNSSAGLRRLRHSVRELEKVNRQFAAFVEKKCTPAMYQPTLRTIATILPHPPPDPEPKHGGTPQYVPPTAPPPAPNPSASSIRSQTQQSSSDRRLRTTLGATSLVVYPATIPEPCDLHRPSCTKPAATPNWAKPAVPTHEPMAGMSCTGKPPPRPEKKTIPFKKTTQTKPSAANRKDFLRPP